MFLGRREKEWMIMYIVHVFGGAKEGCTFGALRKSTHTRISELYKEAIEHIKANKILLN